MQDDGSFIKSIKEEIQNNLPGEKSHIPMSPYKRVSPSYARLKTENPIYSAVAIHIYRSKQGDLEILLIERTQNMSSHKGQIAFPGGKVDKSDHDYFYTAKRESFEELGIKINEGIYLGKLSPVFIPISNFDVHPYVIFHKKPPKIFSNKIEVANCFSIKIKNLLNPSSIQKFNYKNEQGITIKNIPCFHINKKTIWGATALIANELRDVVLNVICKNQKEEQH